MRRVARYVTRDGALADDATQAAWVIAWKKLGNVRDEDHLRPWLVSVAANEAKRLLRRRRRWTDVEASTDRVCGPVGIDPATDIATLVRNRLERLRNRLRQELA